MPANFLHGIETIEIVKGPRPIRTVKSAVIGLVGTAPIFEADADKQSVNQPVLCLSDRHDAQYFGTARAGFTIPQALDAIRDQGGATVIIINVFDPAVHKTAVTSEAHAFAAGVVSLGHAGVAAVVVKNVAGDKTYVADTDYTLNAVTGVLTVKAGGELTATSAVKVTYDYADVSKVENSDIIGEVTVDGDRTGMKAFEDCYTKFGFIPKILISPAFCTQNAVAVELIALAEKLRAFAYLDAPSGTKYQEAIEGRGPSGSINFNTSSKRALLFFPHLKAWDTASNTERLEPYSPRAAGVRAAVDNEFGYWWSLSNKEIKGIIGSELLLTARVNDATTEVNLLNESGIVTVFNDYATGFRTWGNRSSAWPSETGPETFEAVQRTADIIHESIEFSMLQFIDRPLNNALLDAIRESVNGFIRTLIGRGALIDGKCTYDPTKNPVTELALGHITFDIEMMPPPPAERITFESFLNIELLKKIGGK